MTNKIDKFRGIIEVPLNDETIILESLEVNDLFDFLILNKQKEQFLFGVKFLTRVLIKSYPDESPADIEYMVIENYLELLEELMIQLGWTTRKALDEQKKTRDTPKKKLDQKASIALMKARLAADVNAEEIEDKYITACYVLMREFKYTRDEVLHMPATVFLLLLDEMNKQAEKEKEEMKRNKTLKK